MARHRDDVDRRVGRAADRRIDDDAVHERLARQDVGGLQILVDHVDDALAGLIGHLAALAIRRGDRRAARQRHAERFGERVHRRGGAHRVAMADRRRRGGHDVDEFLVVDLARGQPLARFPDHGARSDQLAVVPAVRASGRPTARSPEYRRSPPPSGRPAWSCRSRWSAPRRRSDSRTGFRPGRDRRDCGRAPRSDAGRSPRSDASGIPSGCRRRRGFPRARAAPVRDDGGCTATDRCRSAQCR